MAKQYVSYAIEEAVSWKLEKWRQYLDRKWGSCTRSQVVDYLLDERGVPPNLVQVREEARCS